jgi:hypothetical protein
LEAAREQTAGLVLDQVAAEVEVEVALGPGVGVASSR